MSKAILKFTVENMKRFFVSLGLFTLSNELWNWFENESLVVNAIAITLPFVAFDLIETLYRKYKKSEEMRAGKKLTRLINNSQIRL